MKIETNYHFNQREFLEDRGTAALAGTVSTFGDDPSYVEASISFSDGSGIGTPVYLDLTVWSKDEGDKQLAKLDRIVTVVAGVRETLAARIAAANLTNGE